MPADPFVHLHVASGYSLRHGASSPAALVERAAGLGQEALALTDRDGLYGAVRFVLACRDAGIAPILGVDLAVHPVLDAAGSGPPSPPSGGLGARVRRTPAGRLGSGPTLAERIATGARRTPARGGGDVDPRHPRVLLLARGRTGWASLCRLVSAAHLGLRPDDVEGLALLDHAAADPRALDPHGPAPEVRRGSPVTSLDVVARHADGLVLVLGPESEVGRALARRRPDLAEAALAPWRAVFGRRLAIEVVSHRARDSGLAVSDLSGAPARGLPYSSASAARALGFARAQDLPAVLTHAVRHATRDQAPVVDVLDAIRRLVPLDSRHLDRANGEGFLADGAHMERVAREVVHLSGLASGEHGERREVDRLLADTRALADACRLDPVADLGIGEVHVPELDLLLPAGAAARSSLVRDRGPAVLAAEAVEADRHLRARCDAALTAYLDRTGGRHARRDVHDRLDAELATIAALGFAGYFLTVGEVVDLVRGMGVRVAARGSGAGSLVNHLLGISGVDPLAHGLVMERFLSPLRRALPDIDVDVESARRTEVYERVLERFGGERCAAVSMRDTYRVRHAVRDVGAALGMPPGEIDAFAKAFPHIRARDARQALDELPELRSSGLGRLAARGELDGFLTLVEALDGLPRHIALHPCGVLLSDATLLDRTPVEASWLGFPMSQFDKDDVEELGLLKLDVLGIRMQSSMAYALTEIERVDGVAVDLDAVPLDDDATYALVRSAHTLGCFQIESPGQRELVGKFAPGDLRRPHHRHLPVPSRPGEVRHGHAVPPGAAGLERARLPPPRPAPRAGGDLRRRRLPRAGAARRRGDDRVQPRRGRRGTPQPRVARHPAGGARVVLPRGPGPRLRPRDDRAGVGGAARVRVVRVLQGARGGVRPADLPLGVAQGPPPGGVPRRRPHPRPGDVPQAAHPRRRAQPRHRDPRPRRQRVRGRLRRRARLALRRAAAGGARGAAAPRAGRARSARRIGVRHPARAGRRQGHQRGRGRAHRGRTSVRLAVGLLVPGPRRATRGRAARRRGRVRLALRHRPVHPGPAPRPGDPARPAAAGRRPRPAHPRHRPGRPRDRPRDGLPGPAGAAGPLSSGPTASASTDVVAAARRQAMGPAAATAAADLDVQLTLDLGDAPGEVAPSGLPEMTDAERVRAELEVLGLDASRHVVDFYVPLLEALGVTRSRDLLRRRSRSEILVAGVKVATQTPPVRSGRRVVFLTLDDATGPVDATFFEDVQGPYAATVFGSWLLLVRGLVRRTGPRGISIRATGAWELGAVHDVWRRGGRPAVATLLGTGAGTRSDDDGAVAGRAGSRSSRPVVAPPPSAAPGGYVAARLGETGGSGAGGMGQRGSELSADERAERVRRVLVHASGFRQSPYADIKPQGVDAADTRGQLAAQTAAARAAAGRGRDDDDPAPDDEAARPRRSAPSKLWHSSPGSSGW